MKQIVELARRLRMQDQEDELMFKIAHSINELDETEQAALGMRFIAGEDYGTVAHALHVTENESKNIAHRALLHLRGLVYR